MQVCLPKEFANKFLDALKTGKIQPEKLIVMTSEERRGFLADIVGEADAKEVNALLESKLLLKDQKRGMVSWAKKVAGISEEVRHDMISKIEKMDKVLDANSEETFLADLASKKLGTDVTFEEAKNVADLSKQVTESKAKIQESDPNGSQNRVDYGAARVALQEYVHELKLSNSKQTIKTNIEDFKRSPLGTVREKIKEIGGIAKGINASFDNSYGGRQGFRAIFTNPKLWGKNFLQSWEYIYKQLGKKASDNSVLNGIKADVYSRLNALNGIYQKMKLDIGLDSEEAFPTSLPEKIPGLGRVYKATETAYNGMALRLRADIADQIIKIAKENGVDLTDDLEIQSLGRLVNSLTGRGNLGNLEKVAGGINTVFFSPRSLKANFDFLTLHATDKMSTYARKQAAKNLLKVTAGIATIMATANALQPGSAELDPRSANFGKIKVGDTRFDISGGMLSLVTLASRILSMSSKSSTTGKVTPLNSEKYGASTGLDTIIQFFENKSSPLLSVVINHLKGRDFNGNKPTAVGDIKNLTLPLGVNNAQELLSDPNAANFIIAEIADALGFVTNTYGSKNKN